MKKICFLFGLLASACFALTGCGSQAAPEPSSFFPKEAQKVTVTHWLGGQETKSTLEGEALENLLEWADSLSLEEAITFPEGQSPGQTEEGGELFFFDFDGPGSSLSYRDFDSCYLVKDDRWYPVSNPSAPPIREAALRPMLMVDGEIYLDTGKEDPMGAAAASVYGEILSSVRGFQRPTENGQSNFGFIGSPYTQIGGLVYVNIDGRWIIFEKNTGSEEYDKIPMVMVDGQLYYSTGRESSIDDRCGMMDGEITSTVDGTEIPHRDDQSNFGAGFGYQFAGNGSLEILMPHGDETPRWMIFHPKAPADQLISYHDRWYRQADLSPETLAWLLHYNSLSEVEQLSVSFVPPELIERSEPVETQDAEMPAQSE